MKKTNLMLAFVFMILSINASFGQILYPGGDTCFTAVPIPVGDSFLTPDDEIDSDHWYSFIAPCDGELTVSDHGLYSSDRRLYTDVCGSLVLEAEATWASGDVSYTMFSGESVYIQVDDTWDGSSEFNIEYGGCAEVDSVLLDIAGTVYYDMNNNGIRDATEIGKGLSVMVSDPDGVFTVTGYDGFYYSSVAALADGAYQISPQLDDHWGISSDSLFYTIVVDDLYEQRDSLDFGLYPDSIFYDLNPDLTGGFPRCNDTVIYWLNIQNVGTALASGQIHLELDDSLHYVSADISPDSIVGQNMYWSYENLFFDEFYSILVQVGTPDGLADTVSSNLFTTIDSAGVEMFASTEVLERIITCAYDPNDKTPTPFGIGEFGYIPPTTESIEYLIRFQNTGTDTAFNVVIKDQLDENLDWYSITPLAYSHNMSLEMDIDGEVSFIFNNILLPDSVVNEAASHGFVKYTIDLKPGLPLETSIYNTANIYFDFNPAVITNTAINTLHVDDNSSIDELINNEQLRVYPNPFHEMTTVYFGKELKNHSIEIVDILGNKVYSNSSLSGTKLDIHSKEFKSGMYIIILIDNELNQVVSQTKLMAN